MFERHNAVAGQPVKLSVFWNVLGVALDPHQIRMVQILDFTTGALVATIAEADVHRDGPGRYYVVTPALAAGTYTDRWYVTPTVGGVETTHDYQVMVTAWGGAGALPLTKAQLVARYLYGLNLTDDFGNEYPDEMYSWSIQVGVARAARLLAIDILPVEFYGKDDLTRRQNERDDAGRFGAERHDYYSPDAFSLIKLDHRPLIGGPSEMRLVYPGYDEPVFTIPEEWIRVTTPESATCTVIPGIGSLPSEVLGSGGRLPALVHTRGAHSFPDLLHVDYKAGFEIGRVPDDITHVIALLASQNILNPAGDMIVGAGIASTSLSIGGLSQSIGTTSSATNAGYGARLLQYERDLKAILPTIRGAYHGIGLHVA